MEPYMAGAWHVLVRFGRWDAILARPLPADPDHLVCAATARWARGMARAARGEVALAAAEQAAFAAALARVPATRVVHNVTSRRSLAVAAALLAGELEYRRGRYDGADGAFTLLRRAVALEEALPYDEPWGWGTPVRHALGALLLEQGRRAAAEEVYRADLVRYPKNLWSLGGLSACLAQRAAAEAAAGDAGAGAGGGAGADAGALAAELAATREAAAVAAARADVPVLTSCYCATSTGPDSGKGSDCGSSKFKKRDDDGGGGCCGGRSAEPVCKKARAAE
jgi:hypothetical protein